MTIAPGVYEMPHDTYLSQTKALSFSGAKLLLPPSCPAKFRYRMDHAEPHKDYFDLGHAAHKLVLGAGLEIARIDAPNWRTKAAGQAKKEAYAAGQVPLLAEDADVVQAMADALRRDPIASALFSNGVPEKSLFWTDKSGVDLRGRLDWLPKSDGGRMVLADYKTAKSASPKVFQRSMATFGYFMQAPFYIDGVLALELAEDVAFVFVVQEVEPPHVVAIYEPSAGAVQLGRERNRRAIATFAHCMKTDTWPGYTAGVDLLPLPKWAEYEYAEEA